MTISCYNAPSDFLDKGWTTACVLYGFKSNSMIFKQAFLRAVFCHSSVSLSTQTTSPVAEKDGLSGIHHLHPSSGMVPTAVHTLVQTFVESSLELNTLKIKKLGCGPSKKT